MSILENSKVAWLVALLSVIVTLYLYFHPRTITVEKEVEKEVIKEVVVVKNETTANVLHKTVESDPDVVYNKKDSLKVSVNGKVVDLKPKDSEKFEFGKDYLKLNQESTYSITIDNKLKEPTFSIGMGYSNNHKVAGLMACRIKKTPYHIWGMTDGKTTSAGVMFSLNYK